MPSVTKDAQMAARAAGERFFTISRECPRGHVGRRYASNGGCVECATGKAFKPIHEALSSTIKRYVFTSVIPVELAESDVRLLEAYLTRCMDHYCKLKGVADPPYDMGGVRWSEETGRPLSERP